MVLILVSGFGSFPGVADNPSAHVARALEADPPEGTEVRAAVLPVSFRRAPGGWDELLERTAPRVPDLLLALGVQPKATFRLETGARARLRKRWRGDVDGVVARRGSALERNPRRTRLDLLALAQELEQAGGRPVRISRDAGGYVCERIYHHALMRAAELGCPGLFLHVPPAARVAAQRQAEIVRAWLARIAPRLARS